MKECGVGVSVWTVCQSQACHEYTSVSNAEVRLLSVKGQKTKTVRREKEGFRVPI